MRRHRTAMAMASPTALLVDLELLLLEYINSHHRSISSSPSSINNSSSSSINSSSSSSNTMAVLQWPMPINTWVFHSLRAPTVAFNQVKHRDIIDAIIVTIVTVVVKRATQIVLRQNHKQCQSKALLLRRAWEWNIFIVFQQATDWSTFIERLGRRSRTSSLADPIGRLRRTDRAIDGTSTPSSSLSSQRRTWYWSSVAQWRWLWPSQRRFDLYRTWRT